MTHPKPNPCVKRLKVISSPLRGAAGQFPPFLADKHTASRRISQEYVQINGHQKFLYFHKSATILTSKKTKAKQKPGSAPYVFYRHLLCPSMACNLKSYRGVGKGAKRNGLAFLPDLSLNHILYSPYRQPEEQLGGSDWELSRIQCHGSPFLSYCPFFPSTAQPSPLFSLHALFPACLSSQLLPVSAISSLHLL